MSSIVLCDPNKLYNILNQFDLNGVPCVHTKTYLLLLDVRDIDPYEESHIITARRSFLLPGGDYSLPSDAEVETKQYIVVYDNNSYDLSDKESPVYICAKMLSELTCKINIMVLEGGYERFSAYYPFLKSIQAIFSSRELWNLQLYPIEIIQGSVYIATEGQARNGTMLITMAIKYIVNTCSELKFLPPEGITCVDILLDENEDKTSTLMELAQTIENFRGKKCPVLVVSTDGLSRASVGMLAFLIKKNNWSIEKAWKTLRNQKHYIRPTMKFMKQLSDFEEEICQERKTDISIPNFIL